MNTSDPRHDHFRKLLAALNREQRAAVSQIDGPVLVIAGPGTGKTHILAARIGKILLDTDTLPQHILCLTYTDAGAHAMRERLAQLIGNEAHRVAVHTFHGFCNRVIQENLDLFGRHDLEPAGELDRIEIVRELLAKQPPEHPLRREQKSPFTFERHLLDLFANMKREDWQPGHVHRQIRAYLESLPERPEFRYRRAGKGYQKGDLKTAEIRDEERKMERLAAAADLFPKFNHAMQRAGRYDYEDMILWVVRAFEQHETLLRAYQERFLYVLVDEFQDTNGAQNHLLHRLLDYWESPNIFIVGDDDQSIYEFQGARLQNLLDFYKRHKDNGLSLIVLAENYRSAQPILDTAGRVIGQNRLRAIHAFEFPLEKKLVAVRRPEAPPKGGDLPWPDDSQPSAPLPQVFAYANPLAEETDVAAKIEALRDAGEPLDEVAVLYREHRQSLRLMSLLEKRGIPFETKRPANVLDLPLVRQLRALLEWLRDERREPFAGEHRVFEMLHFRFFGLAPLDVARLASAAAKRAEPPRWREFLADEPFLKQAGIVDFQRVIAISEKLETWLADATELPLPNFLEKTLRESGLLAHVLGLPDRIFHLQTLHTFLDAAKKEAARSPRISLEKWLDQLAALDANNLALPLQQHIRTGAGVQFLTAHGSKGLEFRHVFLIGCTEDFWEKKKAGAQGRFALPDTLTLTQAEDEIEALRRLFYVACTRAKDHLNISFSRQKADGKDAMPSQFVAETSLAVQDVAVSAAHLADAQAALLLAAPRPFVSLPDAARLDDLLENFALSPTSFNRFLRCPLAFYYQDVLRVPGATSENAAFGQAMHAAMEMFFRQMRTSVGRDFPSETALVGYFEAEMEAKRGLFGAENFRQFLALGRVHLPAYYRQERPNWRKNAEVERHVAQVEVDGVPLKGVIDRYEKLDDGTVRVVDYKTGQHRAEKASPPSEKLPHGGDYWRQLVFYKILLEARQPAPGAVSVGVISYLEPDKRSGAFPLREVIFSAEDVAFVRELLVEVDGKIRRHEFSEGCGEPDCAWCQMHRERDWSAWSGANEEEELDDAT